MLHEYRCQECGLQRVGAPAAQPPNEDCPNCGANAWVVSADRAEPADDDGADA